MDDNMMYDAGIGFDPLGVDEEAKYWDDVYSNGPVSRGRVYQVYNKAHRDYYELVRTEILKRKKEKGNVNVLEIGCGTGESCHKWAELGADVIGMDISHEAILKAKMDRIISMAMTRMEERLIYGTDHMYKQHLEIYEKIKPPLFIRFDVNEINVKYKDDLIVGTGILHHLNLSVVMNKIKEALRPGGKIIFIEPLGGNPLINLYRRLTPGRRTKNERPLRRGDIELLNRYFPGLRVYYYHCFSICAALFARTRYFKLAYRFSWWVDKWFFRIPCMKRFAWVAVIEGLKGKD